MDWENLNQIRLVFSCLQRQLMTMSLHQHRVEWMAASQRLHTVRRNLGTQSGDAQKYKRKQWVCLANLVGISIFLTTCVTRTASLLYTQQEKWQIELTIDSMVMNQVNFIRMLRRSFTHFAPKWSSHGPLSRFGSSPTTSKRRTSFLVMSKPNGPPWSKKYCRNHLI